MTTGSETETLDGRLTDVFRDVFKRPTMVLSASTSPSVVEGWDSLTHMRLVLAVEEKFGIKFKTSDISKFHDVGELKRADSEQAFRQAITRRHFFTAAECGRARH